MKTLIASLVVTVLAAPAAFACDSYVTDVERHGLAVKSVMAERRAVQTRFDEAEFQRDRLRDQAEARGMTDALESEIDFFSAEIRKAENDWLERTPEWEAAEAELLTAIAAHEGACGANARTGALMEAYGLRLSR